MAVGVMLGVAVGLAVGDAVGVGLGSGLGDGVGLGAIAETCTVIGRVAWPKPFSCRAMRHWNVYVPSVSGAVTWK